MVGLFLPGRSFSCINDWDTHTTKNKLEVILLVLFNSSFFPPHYIHFPFIRSVQSQSGNLEVRSYMICEMSGTCTIRANFTLMYFLIFLMTMIDISSVMIFPKAEIKTHAKLIALNVLTNLIRWSRVQTSCSFCCFRLFVFLICGIVMMNRIGLNDKFIRDLFIWRLLFCSKSYWWQLEELLLLAVFCVWKIGIIFINTSCVFTRTAAVDMHSYLIIKVCFCWNNNIYSNTDLA